MGCRPAAADGFAHVFTQIHSIAAGCCIDAYLSLPQAYKHNITNICETICTTGTLDLCVSPLLTDPNIVELKSRNRSVISVGGSSRRYVNHITFSLCVFNQIRTETPDQHP